MILSSIFNLMHIILPVIFSLSTKKKEKIFITFKNSSKTLKKENEIQKMNSGEEWLLCQLSKPAVFALPKLTIRLWYPSLVMT